MLRLGSSLTRVGPHTSRAQLAQRGVEAARVERLAAEDERQPLRLRPEHRNTHAITLDGRGDARQRKRSRGCGVADTDRTMRGAGQSFYQPSPPRARDSKRLPVAADPSARASRSPTRIESTARIARRMSAKREPRPPSRPAPHPQASGQTDGPPANGARDEPSKALQGHSEVQPGVSPRHGRWDRKRWGATATACGTATEAARGAASRVRKPSWEPARKQGRPNAPPRPATPLPDRVSRRDP